MSELLGALSAVSPLVAAVVVITVLAIYVLERLFGVAGPFTRLIRAVADRELTRQRREAELEEADRLRNDARVADLLKQNEYLVGELHEARAEVREVRDEARSVARDHDKQTALMRAELAQARDALRQALEELRALREQGAARPGQTPQGSP